MKRSSLHKAALATALFAGVVALVVACGDAPLEAGASSGTMPPSNVGACSTPQDNCPCATPGEEVACGRKVTGDLNFIYCYQGTRVCQPNGAWGTCENGTVSTKSLTRLHTAAVGTVSASCSGGLQSDTISVCTGGRRQGDFCSSNADCTNGERKCFGGSDSTVTCKNDSECQATCGQYNGHCTGGPTPNIGCNVNADCGGDGGAVCTLAAGGGTCGSFNGICNSTGPTDGEACATAADCGGGTCDGPKFGVCIGGKLNGKKCKNTKHCKAGGVCSNDTTSNPDAGVEPPVDPCDPFCNVWSDTAPGIDAGPGFTFLEGGLTPAGCGDGNVIPPESCDDGNTNNGDGCSSSCRVEPGFYCPTPGAACLPSTCGNGVVEGLEQCDDTNTSLGQIDRPYDGCYKCLLEVQCPPGGACTPRCGDGVVMGTEQCDDGNSQSNDGCSATCQVETGSSCTTTATSLPSSIDVPIIFRDVAAEGQLTLPLPNRHPDFQGMKPHTNYGYTCVGAPVGDRTRQGIMADTLAADGAPTAKLPVIGGNNECNATTINSWYRDTAALNTVVLGRSLRLFQTGGPTSSTYQFNSSNDTVTANNINCGNGTTSHCQSLGGFFPINNRGYGPYQSPAPNNYHFTSEVRFPFTYRGGEVLNFTGDDDVFVYVAGRKVVDLGGVHSALSGSTTLVNNMRTVPENAAFTLTPGQTYEIAVFQAERQTVGSNYRLTLGGFTRAASVCTKPPEPQTFVRDYQAVCRPGARVVWQVFRWKAKVDPAAPSDGGDAGASTPQTIAFRAATAETEGALPADRNAASTVAIGTATSANSNPDAWRYDGWAGDPIPVSHRLRDAGQFSQNYLRVYMTFTGGPVLREWQMLYDCIDAE